MYTWICLRCFVTCCVPIFLSRWKYTNKNFSINQIFQTYHSAILLGLPNNSSYQHFFIGKIADKNRRPGHWRRSFSQHLEGNSTGGPNENGQISEGFVVKVSEIGCWFTHDLYTLPETWKWMVGIPVWLMAYFLSWANCWFQGGKLIVWYFVYVHLCFGEHLPGKIRFLLELRPL